MLFLKLSRCFYIVSREMFDRTSSFWYNYYCDLAVFIYGSPRLFYLVWKMCQIETIENELVSATFFSRNPFMFMIIWIFGAFYIYCKTALTKINVSEPVFQFWRQLIVQLQDDYHQCALDATQQENILQKHRLKLSGKIEHKVLLNWFVPKFITQIVSQIIVWKNLENIHQNLFFNQRFQTLPNMSDDCKKKVILVLTVIDQMMLILQVILGKSCTLN